ncbi:MAG: hypothetical protein IKX83_03955 [Clostridia bacterium]|nr:hypothetical protein [Clostridia bacterium]
MYAEEQKTVEAILRSALSSRVDDFRMRLVSLFRSNGFPAYAVGKEPAPDTPSVVVFEEPRYAVIYLFQDRAMNDAEFEVFRAEARAFAWKHDAAAYFVHLDQKEITRETD